MKVKAKIKISEMRNRMICFSPEKLVIAQFAIACTERGGSPTAKEGARAASTPSLTVGLPPQATISLDALASEYSG